MTADHALRRAATIHQGAAPTLYGKNEKENPGAAELKQIVKLIEELK